MSKLVLVVAICTAVASWCQQAPVKKSSVPDLLTKLHSGHLAERSDALDEIRSDRPTLHSTKLQAVLIELLDQENQGKDTSPKEANSESGEADRGEEYAEYFASLREVVASFADWNDQRQACILVYAGSDDYPSAPLPAAARARAAMPCILKRSKSEDALDRAVAGPMLVEAFQKAHGTLDATTTQAVNQIILSNLHDPDEGVRGFTVDALGKFGGADMIPALQQVAIKDPSPEVEGHSIRKSAVEAIAEIQKRMAQH
jgi:hypothetical protein